MLQYMSFELLMLLIAVGSLTAASYRSRTVSPRGGKCCGSE